MNFLFKWLNRVKYIIFTVMILTLLQKYIESILSPYFMKEIIDKLSLNVKDLKQYFYILLLYAFINLFSVFISNLIDYLQIRYDYKFYNIYFINNILKNSLKNSKNYFDKNSSNTIISNIYKLSKNCEYIINTITLTVIPNIIILTIYIFSLKKINTSIVLPIIIWLITYSLISYITSRVNKKNFLELEKTYNDVDSEMNNSLSNISNIKSFSNEMYEINKIKKKSMNNFIVRKKINFLNIINSIISNGFDIFFNIFLFVLLIEKFIKNQLGIDDIFFIFYTIQNMNNYLLSIIKNSFSMYDSFYKVKIHKAYLEDKEIVINKNKNYVKFKNPSININNIYFSYSPENPVFSNFSLSIPPYQKLGIVGYSGAGKSTLINLLLRFYDLNSGSIIIDKYNIKEDITQESLRDNISFIPQDPILFHRTIRENILYGKLNATEEELIEATKKAYCYDFINNLENKFDTLVGERGVKLSGGQRQRIAIARAILKNSPILILDEATSSLDSITEKQIQKALQNLMQNKTVIVIAHRLSTLTNMDRIITLDKGQIVEDGTLTSLLNKPDGLFKKMWEEQMKEKENDY